MNLLITATACGLHPNLGGGSRSTTTSTRQLTLNESARHESLSSEGHPRGNGGRPSPRITFSNNGWSEPSMPVSKRTRYEVLKRDNHTCRYCGGVAPDVVLTVDHVTPVALGGSDKPNNLVAACRDCNAGKSSTSPTDTLVADVQVEDMRWARAIKAAAESMAEIDGERRERSNAFRAAWKGYDDDLSYLPDGWRRSIDCWLDGGLPLESLLECLEIAMGNRTVSFPNVFAYMGGIARKKVEQLHEVAKRLLDAEAVSDGS